MTILIIEDDAAYAALLASYMFSHEGDEVIPVASIDDALPVKCDVAILDLRLPPDFDADISLARIREFHVPVIVLTGLVKGDLASKSLACGAVAFFQKMDAVQKPEEVRAAMVRAVTVGKSETSAPTASVAASSEDAQSIPANPVITEPAIPNQHT